MLKSELAGYMEIFHCGEQYAAVSRELETAFGIKGAELRALVNTLRRGHQKLYLHLGHDW